jgi:hypothetical protein
MNAQNSNNTPLITLFWFKCRCGQIVRKGESYVKDADGFAICMKCAYPEPKERRLIPIDQYLKKAI